MKIREMASNWKIENFYSNLYSINIMDRRNIIWNMLKWKQIVKYNSYLFIINKMIFKYYNYWINITW